jgi:hypothetical protein
VVNVSIGSPRAIPAGSQVRQIAPQPNGHNYYSAVDFSTVSRTDAYREVRLKYSPSRGVIRPTSQRHRASRRSGRGAVPSPL